MYLAEDVARVDAGLTVLAPFTLLAVVIIPLHRILRHLDPVLPCFLRMQTRPTAANLKAESDVMTQAGCL